MIMFLNSFCWLWNPLIIAITSWNCGKYGGSTYQVAYGLQLVTGICRQLQAVVYCFVHIHNSKCKGPVVCQLLWSVWLDWNCFGVAVGVATLYDFVINMKHLISSAPVRFHGTGWDNFNLLQLNYTHTHTHTHTQIFYLPPPTPPPPAWPISCGFTNSDCTYAPKEFTMSWKMFVACAFKS